MAIKCPKCQHENPFDTAYCGKCATPLPGIKEAVHTKTMETPAQELTTGSTFAGRYQIIEELGKGGMGRVYKAVDNRIKEKMALKLIKPEIASDKKTIERFGNELKLARKISHRNICRMYDLGEEKGTHFITMEYVSGENLKSFVRRSGLLSIGKALIIAKQICEGLVEAHRLGIVHRDLKPSNIMIDREGDIKIMDFGIARSLKGKGITGAGVMIGTPEYMSPEQVEAKDVDQRSDIYSLGIILYEMTTGKLPFEADTPFAVGIKQKSETPKAPKEFNPQIPDDLNRMILKCLEKEKEIRYQSTKELLSGLESIEKGIPTTEKLVPKKEPKTSKEMTVTFSLRKLLLPALVLAGLVITVVIVLQMLPRKQASIAVLPFIDLSPQKDQEHLCDGMTTEIITKLSGLQGWKVMNTVSVMQFKNTKKDIKQIGQELGVTKILTGDIQKEKDDIRVNVQLVNVKDRFQIWSDVYEMKIDRIFYIQSNVAENIAIALKKELSPEEKDQIHGKPAEDINAYNFYLRGRYFWNKRTVEDLKKAIEYFEKAIEIDSNYALAYTGLADVYMALPDYELSNQTESFLKGKEAAQKALEIDDTLAEAHASLAIILENLDWDFEGAEKEFLRAIELDPAYAAAHYRYAYYLNHMGRVDEAITETKLALELEPFSLVFNRYMGMIYYYARQYDKAIDSLEKTREMNPTFRTTNLYIGMAYLQKGKYEEALTEFQKEKNMLNHWDSRIEQFFGIAYARMGKINEAQKVLDALLERSEEPLTPFMIARVYISLGENDQAFKWLEKAYENHNSWLLLLKVDPLMDSVRSDPRFTQLMKKIGLE